MGGKRIDIKTAFVCILTNVRSIKNHWDIIGGVL